MDLKKLIEEVEWILKHRGKNCDYIKGIRQTAEALNLGYIEQEASPQQLYDWIKLKDILDIKEA